MVSVCFVAAVTDPVELARRDGETERGFLRLIGELIGDSVELPKWLNTVSGTKKSAKSNPSCLVEGTLSIGCHWGFECAEC